MLTIKASSKGLERRNGETHGERGEILQGASQTYENGAQQPVGLQYGPLDSVSLRSGMDASLTGLLSELL